MRRVRALIVTNMYPTPERPEYGRFVLDQVEALRRRDDVEIELFSFPPGLRSYPAAARALRARRRDGEATTSCTPTSASPRGPRCSPASGPSWSRCTATTSSTRAPTASRARRSRSSRCPPPCRASSASNIPGAGTTRRVAVLPVGIDLHRFRPIPRTRGARAARARPRPPATCSSRTTPPARLSASTARRRRPARPRCCRWASVAPDEVPYWINAANAVLVPSQAEGFGLSVIEALACGVPAFGTPVGIHPVVLSGIAGRLLRAVGQRRLARGAAPAPRGSRPPRVDGRRRAELFSADRMAARVVEAWRALLEERRAPIGAAAR